MRLLSAITFCLLTFTYACSALHVGANPALGKINKEYPKKDYLIGLGEIKKSGNPLSDGRVADVLARREIAAQIKVKVEEESIDIMCQRETFKVFRGDKECRNSVTTIIRTTIEEFLEGSSIIDRGERDGMVYSVAVMPRGVLVNELGGYTEEAINLVRKNIEKVKKGNPMAIGDAVNEYIRARAFDGEKEVVSGLKSDKTPVFEELEKEIKNLMDVK